MCAASLLNSQNLITEFTAHVLILLSTGCLALTVTMQAPQPPSKHIDFVPVSPALMLINLFKVVSMGTVAAETV